MLFTASLFLFFFLPLILLVYFLSPKIFKNILLLVVSLFFYLLSSSDFILILLSSIVSNFYIAIFISQSKNKRGFFLVLGLIVNLGLLFYYKYLGFFGENILNPLITFLNLPAVQLPVIAVPLALSFYTFHALSYLFDVYKHKVEPTRNLFKLTLYFLFFPHLIAGPIVRYGEISNYLDKRSQTLTDFSYGITRLITGLVKKVLIADTLSGVVDQIFNIPPQHMNSETAWLGIISFTLQLYFDFSGYTDMAIGLALMFGFKFPENFNYPYISSSIREFWTRWHMTLSNWIRDYLYYPLALKWAKGSKIKLYISLFITFALVGLWHGANWTYVVFGVIQGTALIFESIKNGNLFNRIPRIFKHVYFLLVMVVSWVFFRSENVGYAIEFLKRLFLDFRTPKIEFRPFSFFIDNEVLLAILIGTVISTPLLQRLVGRIDVIKLFQFQVFRFTFLIIKFFYFMYLLIITMIYIVSQTYNPFIYFKF